MPSQVVSLRLQPEQVQRLRREARRMNKTPCEAGAILIEEALRTSEFGFIEFRQTSEGRLAYLRGTPLAVWELAMVYRDNGGDAERTREYLELPEHLVGAGLRYYEAYRGEIDTLLADNDAIDETTLRQLLPHAKPAIAD